MSNCGGHWYPCFGFLWCLLWVSKPEWVLPYSHCGGKCNVHSLRSSSGATPVDLLTWNVWFSTEYSETKIPWIPLKSHATNFKTNFPSLIFRVKVLLLTPVPSEYYHSFIEFFPVNPPGLIPQWDWTGFWHAEDLEWCQLGVWDRVS